MSAAAESEAVDFERPSRTERLVAKRMAESLATIPAFTVRREVDMGAAVALRAWSRDAGRVVPSLNDLVVRACALALREHPRVNAYWDAEERLAFHQGVHVGVAVDADGMLLVPVLRDADVRPLSELASESRSLVARARARELTPADMAGATFTVSNLGMLGVDDFDAIVSPGQAAILAVGALRREPAFGPDGGVVEAQRMALRLSSDHRLVYGAQAARFLGSVAALLEAPDTLL